GLQNGERVVLLLPPGVAFICFLLATVRCGAVAVPLNPDLQGEELGRLFRQIDPSFLVLWGEPAAWRSTQAAQEGLVAGSNLKAVLLTGPSTAQGYIPLWPPIDGPAQGPAPGRE